MVDVLLVLGTAFLPALEHVVPGDPTLIEEPPLLLGVELGREREVYNVPVLFLVVCTCVSLSDGLLLAYTAMLLYLYQPFLFLVLSYRAQLHYAIYLFMY